MKLKELINEYSVMKLNKLKIDVKETKQKNVQIISKTWNL